jgi:hypothetical protein
MADWPFYVYELIDPRDGKPFYVGKGVRNRVYQHERDAARGAEGPKCDRIRSIEAEGLKVGHRIVRKFKNEIEAYAFEASRIAALGMINLTNISPGGGGGYACEYTTEQDRGLARELGRLAKRTANFTWFPAFVRLGNALYPMGACNVLFLAVTHAKLVGRRGADWVAQNGGPIIPRLQSVGAS